mgnify:FL=1|tara:strand:+ start:1417 stop:1791 length:375 start_codon:yes stop_codon:yes gene_type:complete
MITEIILISLPLLSLWVAGWLHWIFNGQVRHFLFAYLCPAGWRADQSPAEIMLTSSDEFDMFLAAESQAPAFVRGVLACPACMSAYVSAVGLLFYAIAFGPSIFILPLLWVGAAWVGHRLHSYI